MENLMKLFSCLCVIIFLSTAPSLAPKALAQGAEHVRVPFTIPGLYNECTDEFMEISGVFNFVNKETNTANGGRHILSHANVQNATAVGDKGGIYKVTGPLNSFQKCSCGNGATVTTLESHQNFVAKGSTSNLTYTLFFHITTNENGEVTSFTPKVENFKCQ